MNTLNMQMFKDGNRIILAFDNCTSALNEIITRIVTECNGGTQTIKNVNPLNIAEPSMPVINNTAPIYAEKNTDRGYYTTDPAKISYDDNNNTGNIEDINEHKEVEENGFKGFTNVFYFWKKNRNNLSQERNMELLNFFQMYANMLKNTPASEYSERELQVFLMTGLSTVYNNRLNDFLKECGFLTLNELINGGRPVLEYVYNVCVGRN